MKQTINIALTVEFMDEDVFGLTSLVQKQSYKEYIEEKVNQVVDNVYNSYWCDDDSLDWTCIGLLNAELIKD